MGAAILIAIWIISSWLQTGKEHVVKLAGKAADPAVVTSLVHIAYNHDPAIRQIDTMRVYHFGLNFLVECDIVLPPDMPLRQAHDIGEALQIKLEKLPEVERAFVHLDWETSHAPEH